MPNNEITQAVIDRVANGKSYRRAHGVGRNKFDVEGEIVHTRYCSPSSRNNSRYKFNINPNTLESNYELWICGDEQHYYLIPIHVIQEMYDHPEAYVDSHHAEIRVVSVDRDAHTTTYATGGEKVNLSDYFLSTL